MRRLLIVEDDQNILDYLAFALSGIPNLDLLQTPTITSARAMLIENQVDAVLLDLGLPDGNGLDLIESDVFPNDIPTFILTAAIDRDMIVRSIMAGARGYLTKDMPVDASYTEDCADKIKEGYGMAKTLGLSGTPFIYYQDVGGNTQKQSQFLMN